MNRLQVTQYGVDNIGVLAGADLDFAQPDEQPCAECGGPVDLSALIVVRVGEDTKVMSEADARALLATLGIEPPIVLCDQHEPEEA